MRNNSSNYCVNNKKSNFTEVTDLLKAKGVDLTNNRFLILQVRLITQLNAVSNHLHVASTIFGRSLVLGTHFF